MSAAAPSLTVILCNYNHARFLPRALAAIDSQDRAADQIILVDDASTDGSAEILTAFARSRSGVEVLRAPVNLGPTPAAGLALTRAVGDYVIWCAADDEVRPGLFRRADGLIRRWPGIGVVASGTLVEAAADGRLLRNYRLPLPGEEGGLDAATVLATLRQRWFWIAGSGAFIRRSALLELGGWRPELDWFADWFGYYAIALRHGLAYAAEPLSMVREDVASYGKRGAASAERSRVVVALLTLLRTPGFRDLRRGFRAAPLALSIGLGRPYLKALLRRPGDWDLLAPLLAEKLALRLGLSAFQPEAPGASGWPGKACGDRALQSGG